MRRSTAAAAAGPAGRYLGASSALAPLTPHTGGAGLVIGHDRRHAPLVLGLFRPEPTRVVLVGGVRCAQLLVLRAMALGARVLIETARPAVWQTFVQGCGVGPDVVAFGSPGSRPRLPATPGRPQLIMSDVGSTVGQDIAISGGWRAIVVLRDEVTAWDIDMLTSADLVVMQPLTHVEAALVASVIGLTQAQSWLSQIGPEMVAVAGQGRLRWAVLSPTSVERRLLTSVARFG